MPREKKFTFLPVRNEDLRKRKKEDDENIPYVRIQKPGLLVFPRATLEHFDIKLGDIRYIKFYIDVPKRALAFQFVDQMKLSDVKEHKPLSVKQYEGSGLTGSVSIKALLNQFGEWPMPVKCDLDTYQENDEYIHFGKMNYFIIPRVNEGGTSAPVLLICPIEGCGKQCTGKRSLGQHMRLHKNI